MEHLNTSVPLTPNPKELCMISICPDTSTVLNVG